MEIVKKVMLIIIISIVVVVVFFLFAGSILFPTVPKELKICHERYGKSVEKQIEKLNKTQLDREADCLIWKEYVIELEECIENVSKRNSYPKILLLPKVRSTDSVNTYNSSCPDNPIE